MSKDVLQRLLNISVTHVLTQGKPSIGEIIINGKNVNKCLYRSADGCGCGAAPFIVNYNPEMENKSWVTIVNKWPSNVERDATIEVAFVNDLQQAHDFAASKPDNFIHYYKEFIRNIVRAYQLDLPEIFNA